MGTNWATKIKIYSDAYNGIGFMKMADKFSVIILGFRLPSGFVNIFY